MLLETLLETLRKSSWPLWSLLPYWLKRKLNNQTLDKHAHPYPIKICCKYNIIFFYLMSQTGRSMIYHFPDITAHTFPVLQLTLFQYYASQYTACHLPTTKVSHILLFQENISGAFLVQHFCHFYPTACSLLYPVRALQRIWKYIASLSCESHILLLFSFGIFRRLDFGLMASINCHFSAFQNCLKPRQMADIVIFGQRMFRGVKQILFSCHENVVRRCSSLIIW